MKKRVVSMMLVAGMCIGLLAGCGSQGGSNNAADNGSAPTESSSKNNSDDVTVIRIGGTVNESHPVTITEMKFEELFEAATDGKYDVQVYPACTIGSPLEMLEAVQLGNLEICDSGNMVVESFTNELSFMSIPYLFSSSDVTMEFVSSDLMKETYARMGQDCGLHPYCPVNLGFMTLSNNVREIHTPEDLKGIKFRVQETDMYMQYWNSLGGSPMPMALNECFTAIQQGTIDGITTQNAVFYSSGYQEVIKYISDANPYACVAYMYASEKFLNSLDSETREIFEDCMEQAYEYGKTVAADYIEEVDAILEEECVITHLTDEERAMFVDSAEFMYDYAREKTGSERLDAYLAEIEKIEASSEN